MGYGIIVYLDADAADGVGDAELAVSFRDAVNATCPLVGLDPGWFGPWQRVGAFSSAAPVELAVSADGVELGAAPTGTGAVVSPAHTSGQTDAAVRRMGRGQPAAPGDAATALFGPDPLEGDRAAGSLWWVYAGGVGELAGVDPAWLGARLREVHRARWGASIDVGRWLSLVNCAGRVGRSGYAAARWEGNRITWVRNGDPAAV